MHQDFVTALRPHYEDALRYCRVLCARSASEEAEDVLQQALLHALKEFGTLHEPARFRGWFFKIITNTFYANRRRAFWKRFVSLEDLSAHRSMPSVYPTDERNEVRQILRKALAKLSAKERTALLLFEIGGFSIREIAVMQGDNSLSAVKSRLVRARRRLQKHIERLERTGLGPSIPSNDLADDLEQETLNSIPLSTPSLP